MPVAFLLNASRRLRLLATLLLLVHVSPFLRSATRAPETRIPLESLGYLAFPHPVLASGASILTLNYVDDRHLLVTFSLRRLLKRIPDDPPDDVDRSIDAVLIDLPSGEVLARTAWRLHDPAQYLWPLGNGHFLLRIRDRLTTIAPLANLQSGEPFREHPLLSSPRPIGAVLLSPDASLLILESLDHLPPVSEHSPSPGTSAYAAAQAARAAAADDPVIKPLGTRNPVEIHFYRLRTIAEKNGEVQAVSSGMLRARNLVSIPADGAGFLSILDEGKQHWAFNYNFYRGKVEELSPFDSTCHPLPIFVSRSEFVAFGCRSGTQRQMFGGFNLRGEEMWEQAIPETYLNPTFSFAAATGRFAFGHLNTSAVVGDPALANLDQFTSQSVTVFQTDSGKPILRLDCTPVLPSGQNFDLSPDGTALAVIRDSNIEIHRLPPLSAKDRAGLAKAAALAPEPTEGPVLLFAPLSNASARAATTAGTPVPTPPTDPLSHRPSAIVDSDTVVPAADTPSRTAGPTTGDTPAASPSDTDSHGHPANVTSTPAQPAPAIIENGDPPPQPEGPRKPPTLYGPGESPNRNQEPPRNP